MELEEEKKKEGSSYRYWVREATADAAPPPLPQKLSNNDVALNAAPASLGSLWNRVCFFFFSFSSVNSCYHSSLYALTLLSCILHRLALGRRKVSPNGPLTD